MNRYTFSTSLCGYLHNKSNQSILKAQGVTKSVKWKWAPPSTMKQKSTLGAHKRHFNLKKKKKLNSIDFFLSLIQPCQNCWHLVRIRNVYLVMIQDSVPKSTEITLVTSQYFVFHCALSHLKCCRLSVLILQNVKMGNGPTFQPRRPQSMDIGWAHIYISRSSTSPYPQTNSLVRKIL